MGLDFDNIKKLKAKFCPFKLFATGAMWLTSDSRNGNTIVDHKFYRYDLSAFSGMEIESITFGAIKDAVVDKFCVEDCAPLYQRVLLGCCTASMIQDTGKEHFNSVMKREQER